MIDTKLLKEKRDEILKNIKLRNMKIDLKLIEKHSALRSEYLKKIEELRFERNDNAKTMKGKIEEAVRKKLIERGQILKEKISELEKKLAEVESLYNNSVKTIPNFMNSKVPIRDDGDLSNIVLKKVGDVPKFNFKAKDHLEIAKLCDLIDFDTATKVSGLKFYYLKNEAVLLELALEQYALSICMKHGFIPIITPDVAKNEILEGIGFSPRGEESNIYTIEGTDTSLVGTAEITLGGYYSGQTILEENLPIRFVGLSHCFRREAGASGQFSKGLYRVHQFSKVEMFVYCMPEDSEKEHDKLLEIEEEIFSGLKLAYQVIDTPSWDLGAPAARKFDIEAWMPGRGENGEYGEVTSTSNCTDYQSRSLKIKYKKKNGDSDYLHTLNGTAVAVSRALVAILENYQNEDGSVNIPDVLLPYMGGKKIIKCRN